MNNSTAFLSQALPVEGRALSLRTSFNESLLESLKYLLDACVEVIPEDLFFQANQKLGSLNPEFKLSGLLSQINADFFNAVEKKDIQRIIAISRKLSTNDFQVKNMAYLNLSNLDDYYSPLVKHTFSQETMAKASFFPLSSEHFQQVQESLQRGFGILQRSFSDFFKESQELISEVLIMNSEGLKAGSSFDLFGMIYASYLYKWKKVSEILDLITHEQAHLYVYLLNKDDPLVLNPKEFHESPLRKEKRPLMGIYHATFVLARIYHVLTKALALNEIPKEEKDYCKELQDYYQKRCKVGLEILQTHAKMTPLGEGLILSASKLVQ
ncbi:MAG: hypothetical protein BGO67_12115 [Alphaproteobacteria bacterium 41-28]|nr:MAG: hypothetical protein BGO67_12115 [Alphaproteobacteria bacterium 41-28]